MTGRLRSWDVTARLPEIDVPTLVTGGRYDEAGPSTWVCRDQRR